MPIAGLARIVGIPEGIRGISLFMVPKFRIKAYGSLGEFNDDAGPAAIIRPPDVRHQLPVTAGRPASIRVMDGAAIDMEDAGFGG